MTKTNAAATKTRRIAGHAITLRTGIRYCAGRPFAALGRTVYPVTIEPMSSAPIGTPSVVIADLTYDEANKLLLAFNNGPTTFDGRVW